jgi:glycerophosphoryl diester phosphodiesterase
MCGNVPENTLAAVLECERRGVPMVEIDTQETSDGVVVVMHDGEVDRTTDGEMRFPGRTSVNRLTLEEFKSLVIEDSGCESEPEADPDRCHPPTLEEVLDRTGAQLLLDIDFKGGDAHTVAELVKAAGAGDRVMFFDSDPENLRDFRSILPDGVVMPRARDADEVAALLAPEYSDLDLKWIHGDPWFIDEVTQQVEAEGIRLYVNGWDDVVDPILWIAELESDPEKKKEYQDQAWEALDKLIRQGARCFGTDLAHLYVEHLYPEGFGLD